MIVGSVLIQPQKIARARGRGRFDTLVQDFMVIVPRLLVDGAFEGPTMDGLGRAMLSAVERIGGRITPGLARVRQRAQGFIAPIEALMDRIGSAMDGSKDLAESAREIEATLKDLADRIESLGADNLRIISDQISLLIQSDLGLSREFIEDQIWTFVDEALAALEVSPPGERDRDRRNRLGVVSILRRLKLEARDMFALPEFDPGEVAGVLVGLLRDAGAKAAAQRAACVSRQAGKAAGAAATIIEAAPLSLSGSIGAASPTPNGHTYSWYASWLLKDDVWIDKNGRTLKRNYRVVAEKDGVTFADIPEFTDAGGPEGVRYTFARHSFDECEAHARVWSWVGDGLTAGAHLLDVTLLTQSRILSNVLNIIANTGTSLFNGLYKAPMRWWLFDSLHWREPSMCCCACCDPCWRFITWAVVGPASMATIIGSFDHYHSNSISYYNELAFWVTLILPDAYRALSYGGIMETLRDIWLTWMTLRNHVHDPSRPASNIARHEGMWKPMSALAVNLFVRLLPRRYYFIPNDKAEHTAPLFVFILLVAPVTAVVGLIAGWYSWQAILTGGKIHDQGIVKQILKTYAWTALLIFPSMFIMTRAGDTGGGTYNPGGTSDYAGYPSQSTSPYKLPYGSQRGRIYVGQANLGFFSHQGPPTRDRDQVYAYDFGLDHGEWILAARAGTVVAANDTFDDENTDDPNTIVIRHDTVDNDHDKNPLTGAAQTTFARYLHGAQGSIAEAFGVATGSAAVNLTVVQGQRIMRSGDTGTSFHNHLHLAVYHDQGGNTRSVPFVFSDADNVIGDDGVCLPGREYKASMEDID